MNSILEFYDVFTRSISTSTQLATQINFAHVNYKKYKMNSNKTYIAVWIS
jgi:hypothetical protein